MSLKAALAGRFQLEAAYGYTNAIDVATGRPQLRAPKAVSSATLSWQGAKANLALSVRSQTSQADTALDGFSPVVRPGYAVADLAGSYVLSSRVILTARVENLAGDSYQEAYGFGAPGRAVYLGLRLTQ